jgi:predicted nucleic acid-binding protein
MARVFWDTNLFIYLLENNPDWSPRVVELRQKMLSRGDQLLTSWLTVGEVLTKPRELRNSMIEKSYLNFFTSGAIEVIAFEMEAAKRYGEIRSRERLRPTDAIQLACAAAAGTDLFVTNDSHLSGLVVPGVTFITGIERIPY